MKHTPYTYDKEIASGHIIEMKEMLVMYEWNCTWESKVISHKSGKDGYVGVVYTENVAIYKPSYGWYRVMYCETNNSIFEQLSDLNILTAVVNKDLMAGFEGLLSKLEKLVNIYIDAHIDMKSLG